MSSIFILIKSKKKNTNRDCLFLFFLIARLTHLFRPFLFRCQYPWFSFFSVRFIDSNKKASDESDSHNIFSWKFLSKSQISFTMIRIDSEGNGSRFDWISIESRSSQSISQNFQFFFEILTFFFDIFFLIEINSQPYLMEF